MLGSATHSFELMLSAFISASTWARVYIRGDSTRCATRCGHARVWQVAMGLFAV